MPSAARKLRSRPSDAPVSRTARPRARPSRPPRVLPGRGFAGPDPVPEPTESTTEPPLRSVLDALRTLSRPPAGRRVPLWWPLPAGLVAGGVCGLLYAGLAEPQFTAKNYVVVSAGPQTEAASAIGYAQAYGKIATDPVVTAAAEADAGVAPGTLRSGAKAGTSPDAPMIEITYTAESPVAASDRADAIAQALIDTTERSAKKTGADLTLLARAETPTTPVSPSASVAGAVGACAGGLVGGLVLLARQQPRGAGAAVPAPAEGDNRARAGKPPVRPGRRARTEAGR